MLPNKTNNDFPMLFNLNNIKQRKITRLTAELTCGSVRQRPSAVGKSIYCTTKVSLNERRISLKAYSKQTGAKANYAACLKEPPHKLEVIAIILQTQQHLVHAQQPLSAWKESLERKESIEGERRPERTGSGQKCNKVFNHYCYFI